ncbi:MAG: ABC transporter permease [Verrucomicrobiales bacterium]|nr:ABC transporter permease [Verrucomicrobiales bacterium]
MIRRARFFRFVPVVERELRMAARGRALYRWRMVVVTLALGLMAVLTSVMSGAQTPAETQGRHLFHALLVVSAVYALLASISVTADSISREKREGTLGLLFLTDLRGLDIVLGKLAASSLHTTYGLIGLLPLLAIPVMLGGVSIYGGIVATAAVVNLLFLSLAVGIFVSTISWDERRSTFAAMVTMLVLMLGPMLIGGIWVWLFGRGTLAQVLFSGLSPLFPLLASVPGPGGVLPWSPTLGLLPSHLLGWLLLLVAGRWVEQAWHSRSGNPVRRTVDERVFTSADPVARSASRRRMLEAHPLVWLLERHPGKRFYADGLIFAIMAIWVWGYRTYGTGMFGGPGWFLIVPVAILIHVVMAAWVVAESSMRLLEDRRSGALELLLCTSLTDRDLVRGHRLALRRLFLRPVILLAAAEVFVAFTGFGQEGDEVSTHGRWMLLAMAFAVSLDTHSLSWIAMRLAVSLPTVNRVGLMALAITPFGPMVLTLLAATLLGVMTGGWRELTFPLVLGIWVSWVLVVDLVVGQWWCRRWVLREFREAVAKVQPRAAVAG